jgi:DNA-nicking Smr family endonuclease
MRPKFHITESEKALFRQTVKKAKPLTHTKLPAHIKPSARAKVAPIPVEEAIFDFLELEDLPPVTSDDYLQFTRPGIQHKILRKLKAGQYNIEAILDLHGKTIVEANQALSTFISTCQKKAVRHALIIHGKGQMRQKPVLKNKLNHWLRQCDAVLAFCTAKPKQGHTGALYVLFKKGD